MNNLLIIDFIVDANKVDNKIKVYNSIQNDYKIWHQRLGHIGKSRFLKLKNKQVVPDITQIENVTIDESLCEACINGKQKRLPFNKNKYKSYIERPLFIVRSDVCGPITPSTIDNKNYFVMFIDIFNNIISNIFNYV